MQWRLLCMAKLKGVALQWLYADPARIIQPFEELLQQLKLEFDGKVTKGELRRDFERRNWKFGESFVTYYDSKVGLARDVNMDKEELVDGIIEGIPVDNLRMQAKLQSFESAEKVFRVFAGLILPVQQRSDAKGLDKSEAARSGAVKELRCYNCNIKGHWKKDCKLPIREKGTCYGCGSAEHLVAQCPKRKTEAGNNYVRPVEIYFSKGINKSIITEALIDSGISVSFTILR